MVAPDVGHVLPEEHHEDVVPVVLGIDDTAEGIARAPGDVVDFGLDLGKGWGGGGGRGGRRIEGRNVGRVRGCGGGGGSGAGGRGEGGGTYSGRATFLDRAGSDEELCADDDVGIWQIEDVSGGA